MRGLARGCAALMVWCGVAVGAQEIHPASPQLPLQYGPWVVGEPVTAVRVLDFFPSEANLNGVPVHGEQVFARDSEGRERSEVHYDTGETAVTILDPKSKTELRWVTGKKYAVLFPMKPWTMAEPPRRQGKLERVLEGVETHGVVTQPTERNRWVAESWFAADLHLAMLTVIDDPAVGKTVYSFQQVEREEPDKSLFRAPHGLKVIDSRERQAEVTMVEYVPGWPYLPGRVWARAPERTRPPHPAPPHR